MSNSASLTTALANHQVNDNNFGYNNADSYNKTARRLTAPSIVAQVRSLASRTRDSVYQSTQANSAAASSSSRQQQQQGRSASRKSASAANRRSNASSSSSMPSIATPAPITMKLLLVVCRCHNDTFQGAIIDGNLDALKDAHEKLSAANIPVEFKELHGSDKKPRLEVHEVAVRHGGARRGSITAPDSQHGHLQAASHHRDRDGHHGDGGGGGSSHGRHIGYCPIKTTDILAVLGTYGYDIISSAGMSDGRLLYTLRKP